MCPLSRQPTTGKSRGSHTGRGSGTTSPCLSFLTRRWGWRSITSLGIFTLLIFKNQWWCFGFKSLITSCISFLAHKTCYTHTKKKPTSFHSLRKNKDVFQLSQQNRDYFTISQPAMLLHVWLIGTSCCIFSGSFLSKIFVISSMLAYHILKQVQRLARMWKRLWKPFWT